MPDMTCPKCGVSLHLPLTQSGTEYPCPGCGSVILTAPSTPAPSEAPKRDAFGTLAVRWEEPPEAPKRDTFGTLAVRWEEPPEPSPAASPHFAAPPPPRPRLEPPAPPRPVPPPPPRRPPPSAPAPSGSPAVPGYEILGELGRGAMGVVYQARHVTLKRLVALKMIRDSSLAGPDDRVRFQVEAEALASLQHPNIVQIYEIGDAEGLPFFSLELVEGGSLAKKLAGQLPPFRDTAELIAALARAVHVAHQAGIIHRDLKPANVLLMKDGTPKITDFGLAKQVKSASSQTHSSAVMGTPSYMAPEQAAGNAEEVGPAADVYSLGAMLYALLTGRPPFRGASVMDTLQMVQNDEPTPPTRLRPKVPLDLETICLKCLEKAPAKRYASAGALAYDLQRWLEGEPILARPLGRPERVWRWCRRNPVPAGLLLAVTLGGSLGLWHLSNVSQELVHSTALDSARQQAEMLEIVGNYYSSNVVKNAKDGGATAGHDYADLKNKGRIPVPATLTIEIGQKISAETETGQQVRMYSNYPWPERVASGEGGPKDRFEKDALAFLEANAGTDKKEYWSFEEYKGQPVLRYAKARTMQASCLGCHNAPNSPKPGWKVGDVRGAVEIIRPLQKDMERASDGLRSTFILVGAISVGLLGLSTLLLVVSNRRSRRKRAEEEV